MIVNKSIDLAKLQSEAVTAGVSLPRGLGMSGSNLFTYDAGGNPVEPPVGLQAVVDAHTDTREADAAAEAATAAGLPTHIQSLIAARDALQTARTAVASARTLVNTTDDAIQGLSATPSAAALRAAVTGLSTATRGFVAAQIDADLAIEDGLHALHDAIQALKARR